MNDKMQSYTTIQLHDEVARLESREKQLLTEISSWKRWLNDAEQDIASLRGMLIRVKGVLEGLSTHAVVFDANRLIESVTERQE